MRTLEVVANEKWIVWLNTLLPADRRAVLERELYYFDEFMGCRMTVTEILEDACFIHAYYP